MILIDTNVASEPLRPRPDERVLDWLAAQASRVALSAVSLEELLLGVGRLPEGARRSALVPGVDALRVGLGGRLLPFAEVEAAMTADVRVERERTGRPVSYADAMIAGTARAHGLAVATRNTRDFDGLGLELVDPWRH